MLGTITVGFKLLDKKVGKVKVAGLSELGVYPHGEGVGRRALLFVEAIADPLPVVGFAEDNVLGFYESCSWYVGRKIDGKFLVSSEPVDDSKFEGGIW